MTQQAMPGNDVVSPAGENSTIPLIGEGKALKKGTQSPYLCRPQSEKE